MAIDYRGLRSLTARELIAALNRDGFYFVRQIGSHQRYAHVDGRRVTVPPHAGGDTFTIKTIKSIIERQGEGGRAELGGPGVLHKKKCKKHARKTPTPLG